MIDLAVSLRVALFHSVSDRSSAFTDGLGVTTSTRDFRGRIDFLRRRYHPVDLETVVAATRGEPLPRRALLVTIDDAYASVADPMAAILDAAGVPSVFFVNGAFVDHRDLGTDNLVTYAINTVGGGAVQAAADSVDGGRSAGSIDDALGSFVPTLDQPALRRFRAALAASLDDDPLERARDEGLYIDSGSLRALPPSMAIGSHTSTHVRCRTLGPADFGPELADNRARLEAITERPVGAFSVPYGSRADLTPTVAAALVDTGHEPVFLVEGQLNHGRPRAEAIYRVSMKSRSDLGSRLELDVFPRLRYLRDQVLRR